MPLQTLLYSFEYNGKIDYHFFPVLWKPFMTILEKSIMYFKILPNAFEALDKGGELVITPPEVNACTDEENFDDDFLNDESFPQEVIDTLDIMQKIAEEIFDLNDDKNKQKIRRQKFQYKTLQQKLQFDLKKERPVYEKCKLGESLTKLLLH